MGCWRSVTAWSVWRRSQWGQPKPQPLAKCFVCPMTMFVFCFFVCVFCYVCLPLWLTDANTPKKCRALFGLDQLNLWCKPCRYTLTVVSMRGEPSWLLPSPWYKSSFSSTLFPGMFPDGRHFICSSSWCEPPARNFQIKAGHSCLL